MKRIKNNIVLYRLCVWKGWVKKHKEAVDERRGFFSIGVSDSKYIAYSMYVVLGATYTEKIIIIIITKDF